ncbi:Gmad2 immunoglobulin-like domain-containing protein [Gillisia sp. CAL575]|uniref:Gmad2 immunoglobulin-like domain-containing protein n=1 Tax=Gillisia sp. CAL575 TaxID=985255 RepID=UPI0006880E81|nr:Gmad2 immunoglobulin-like domain-containing protein [Gillisia sp. CAL575]
MKFITCFIILLLFSCNDHQKEDEKLKVNDVLISGDSTQIDNPIKTKKEIAEKYANQRFRKVTVEKIASNKFRFQGEAQIFEANFNWVIEDGHYELKKGYEMTDAGAPEWGKFDFTIEAHKKRDNSTLNIVLFEISAKDGSRQYELQIPLK